MCYKFDIDWDSMPFSFSLVDEVDSRYNQWWADNLPKMLAQLRQHFSDDGIDEKELLQGFEEFKRKYCEQRGHRLAPTPTGAKIIKLVYDEITSYREMTEIMGDLEYEVKKLPELYSIYEALHSIIDIYDNYCLDLDEILESNPSQTATTDKAKGEKSEEFHIDNIDVEELSGYFKKEFKGRDGHFDYFSRLVGDMKHLTNQKEMGMLAVMIRHSPYYNKKHQTFASWLRAFCKIVHQPYPKDMHPNKYSPSEQFQKRFNYLHSDFKVDK